MIIGSISENKDFEKRIAITPDIAKKYKGKIKSIFHFGEFSRIFQSFRKFDECYQSNSTTFIFWLNLFFEYKEVPGDYCESVIPDPIPNSEVKPFSADGTLS